MPFTSTEINRLNTIARAAGERIMPYFHGSRSARAKEDKSPVTDADIAAHDYIVTELAAHFPTIPIISEEDEALSSLEPSARFFLVDPLDGTRSFISGEGEFTVNIGLIEQGKPVAGVIYLPVGDALYWGGVNIAAMRHLKGGAPEPIAVKAPDAAGLVVTRSQSHPSKATFAFLETLSIKAMRPASSSIKLCWVAEGTADCYPRFGRTMEWDTAAGHAILNAAGGRLETVDGDELLYGKAGFENPGFVAWGK